MIPIVPRKKRTPIPITIRPMMSRALRLPFTTRPATMSFSVIRSGSLDLLSSIAGLPAAAAASLFQERVPHDRDPDPDDEKGPGILIGEAEDLEIDHQEPEPRHHEAHPRSCRGRPPRIVDLRG